MALLSKNTPAQFVLLALIVFASIYTTLALHSTSEPKLTTMSPAHGRHATHALGHPTPHRHCHFHAGIEHCTDEHNHGGSTAPACGKVTREYDIPLRLIFVVVVGCASSIGVFTPILLGSAKLAKGSDHVVVAMKQCGTGVILSTAFVHLLTHSNLMFTNECIEHFNLFEGTAATIMMAGIFVSFLFELAVKYKTQSNRFDRTSESGSEGGAIIPPADHKHANLLMLEAGLVFHSILIGITLVVVGDSYFITLAIVISFHQMFEGLALGTRIAALSHENSSPPKIWEVRNDETPLLPSHQSTAWSPRSDMWLKHWLPICFILVTPLGMLIGIAILGIFNGNDPATIIAIGTLDAFSAGILAWLGIVEMLAHDWLLHAGDEMTGHGITGVVVGLGSLVVGMVMMTVLGKWA